MIEKKHIKLAQLIWDFHHMNHSLEKSDCVMVFGSHDTRVAETGAKLWLAGYAPSILFSGGLGRITSKLRKQSEAEKFASLAVDMGVSPDAILIEKEARNSSENIRFSMDLLKTKNIKHDNIIVVQKPYMERRAFATFKKRFPEQNILMASQETSMLDYTNEEISLERLINLMVGDLQRIIEYPNKGFQIAQDVPQEIISAMEELIKAGFDKQLIK